MKKIVPILLALLLLAGCKIDTAIRTDTIVDIPLDPTDAPTEAVTEEVTEAPTEPPTEASTEAPTEAPTEPATEKPTEKPKSSSKGSSGKGSSKKPSSGNSSSKDKTAEKPQATEPPTQAPTEAPSVSSYSPTKLDKAVIAAINTRRAEEGLPELSSSKKLATAAAQRACELSISWGHTRPDGSGYSTVLKEFGVSGSAEAELVCFVIGSESADTVVEKWENSKEQRRGMLSADADTIGVGSYTTDGMTYIVALLIH